MAQPARLAGGDPHALRRDVEAVALDREARGVERQLDRRGAGRDARDVRALERAIERADRARTRVAGRPGLDDDAAGERERAGLATELARRREEVEGVVAHGAIHSSKSATAARTFASECARSAAIRSRMRGSGTES